MLWNRVGFDLDHFALEQTLTRPFTDSFLEALDQGLVLLHRAGANGHVVELGKTQA